jgi:predicted amidohydrolase
MLRVGIVQMASGPVKGENIRKAEKMICEALEGGARLVILPELFSFLPLKIDRDAYRSNSETLSGPTTNWLRDLSRKNGTAIVGGSMIEAGGGMLYNTSCLILPSGEVCPYRKVHLFKYGEINEAQVFSEGGRGEVFVWDRVRLGLTICYDLRFPELYRAEALLGAKAICNVAAFLEKTGRAHWLTLLRARAIENQVFILAANQALSDRPGPRYYGNSCIIDPWGKVVARAGNGEEVILGDIDLARVDMVRERLPSLSSRRPDAYGFGL